jgi:glutamate racemase
VRIGFFDSGIGGLALLEAALKTFPNNQYLYLADNAFAPYGDKTEQEIKQRCLAIQSYFELQDVEAIVVACNTATAIAVEEMRAKTALPIIGVEPAIKPAALSEQTEVAVLATKATLLSERYKKLKAKYDGKGIYESACAGWVTALEKNHRENWLNLLESAMAEIKENKVSHIVLGCTHYIGLKDRIQDYLGYDLTFYEPTSGVMQRMKQILGESLEDSTQESDVQLMATNSADRLEEWAESKSLKKHSVSVIDL